MSPLSGWLLQSAAVRELCFKYNHSHRWSYMLIDCVLGIALLNLSLEFDVLSYIPVFTHKTVETLDYIIEWILNNPAGLKLNNQLNGVLAAFFRGHIQLWQVYMDVIYVSHLGQLLCLTAFAGGSVFLAACADLILLTTLHFFCFYVYMVRNLKGLDVSGSILVNGCTISGQISEISGYVEQEELFVSTLTVAEHLNVQADLRLVGMSAEQRRQRVDEVIQELGLRKCRNTRIGKTGGRKGISGGETKRLMLASELLDNPPLLFCDEPTTGIDSAKAESVVNVMRALAQSGHTIICTIHQPSSAIFRKFDKVMFVANGRLAYFGTPLNSIQAFESFGYPCPKNYNPADMIIETLSVEAKNEEASRQRIDEICRKFEDSREGRRLVEIVERTRSASIDKPPSKIKRKMAPPARAKLVQKIFMGVFVGLLYFQTPLNWVGISNLNGAIYYLVSELTYSTLFGILSFLPAEYPLLVREYHDSLYYLLSYYLARALSYLPLFTLDGLAMNCIAYWMIGLTPTFYRFLIALGVGILAEQSAAAFGVMLSILSLTGGLYANIGELPSYISFFQYLSWFRYGFEALSINQLLSLTWIALQTFWRAFRSKKWNPLKQRVDSVHLDSREMFMVTVLFLMTVLLLPTVLVYFTVFYLYAALQLRKLASAFCS
ncbi:ABC transporter ATP-binding protein/permease wht-3 [Aphelenchoides fujianensis]|nr:ABC transporter ATP-binding protein/permease wht-3 [Aphelenchoides fujianensis]